METKLISKPTHLQVTLTLEEALILRKYLTAGVKAEGFSSIPEQDLFNCAVRELEEAQPR